MNVHHLELFYHVATHGGITEAVRKMPYGIQQPAVSGQMLQLETHLGVKLFQRRPFVLTPAGQELFDFVRPFFSRLAQVESSLRGEAQAHLRLAAMTTALSHHLPEVLNSLRQDIPALRLTLKTLPHSALEPALRSQEIDIALTVPCGRMDPDLVTEPLLELPLVLLAPLESPHDSFEALVEANASRSISHPLITLAKSEAVSQLFQQGLEASELRWSPSLEVSELGLVQNYAAKGFGYGLTVDFPGAGWPEGLKVLPLPQAFPHLSLVALYLEARKPIVRRFLELVRAYARRLSENRQDTEAKPRPQRRRRKGMDS